MLWTCVSYDTNIKALHKYHLACVDAIGSGSVFPTHCNRFNRLKALRV